MKGVLFKIGFVLLALMPWGWIVAGSLYAYCVWKRRRIEVSN